jgi:hypothetical protein
MTEPYKVSDCGCGRAGDHNVDNDDDNDGDDDIDYKIFLVY